MCNSMQINKHSKDHQFRTNRLSKSEDSKSLVFKVETHLCNKIFQVYSRYYLIIVLLAVYAFFHKEQQAPLSNETNMIEDRVPGAQAKRMHQIVPIDLENYKFSPLLRYPLSPKVPKFCQSLIWVPPLLKTWIRPCCPLQF